MEFKSNEDIEINQGDEYTLHSFSKEGIFSYLNLRSDHPQVKLVFSFGEKRSVLPTLKKLYDVYFANQLEVGNDFFLYKYDTSTDIYSLVFSPNGTLYAKEGAEVRIYNASDTTVSISYLLRTSEKTPKVKGTMEYGW